MSARLGAGNKGIEYTLRQLPADHRFWPPRLFPRRLSGYTLHIHPRDEAGGQAVSALRNRGLALAACALGQSVDHILSFFHMLGTEIAFYIGGVNLQERLSTLGLTTVIPILAGLGERRFACRGLYDVCLAISTNKAVVGNDVDGNDKNLVVITGANQGGKSTFLRSVGPAQVMMQSGLFAGAEAFGANIVRGVFTHYKREEDTSMTSGKFDEELNRMNASADMLHPHALILFNESFASTNEREGSEIARQIVMALLDSGLNRGLRRLVRGWPAPGPTAVARAAESLTRVSSHPHRRNPNARRIPAPDTDSLVTSRRGRLCTSLRGRGAGWNARCADGRRARPRRSA